MIKELLKKNLVSFISGISNWEEAVALSGKRLVEESYIDESYVKEIVDNVKEHGPYIVLIPGVAMPHATVGAHGVLKTGISLTIFDEDIHFEEGKYARLFFTVATNNAEEHLKNIQDLMELLMNENTLEVLLNSKTEQDLLKI